MVYLHTQGAVTFKQPVVYEGKCNIDYIFFISEARGMAQPEINDI